MSNFVEYLVMDMANNLERFVHKISQIKTQNCSKLSQLNVEDPQNLKNV
jgi:hypothetical protein